MDKAEILLKNTYVALKATESLELSGSKYKTTHEVAEAIEDYFVMHYKDVDESPS